MDINKVKILIAVVLVIGALGIAYALDFSKWKEIKEVDNQIVQVKSQIQAKKNYYASIDSKIKALNDAGWDSKKDSIAINFDSSLFFTPKINNFFKTIVTLSGMQLSSMTSSLPESIKSQSQVPTTTTETGTEISKVDEISNATTPVTSNNFSRLQGPIRKTTINLNVAGTYIAFKNLLTQFQNQTRVINIKSIAVSSAGQEEGIKTKSVVNNLSFSIILDVYSY
ncbi:hypothetical protein M0Q50_01675 [bacterium]|jgi:hypothetical protein|nr:hypothetical protein [bacterium]